MRLRYGVPLWALNKHIQWGKDFCPFLPSVDSFLAIPSYQSLTQSWFFMPIMLLVCIKRVLGINLRETEYVFFSGPSLVLPLGCMKYQRYFIEKFSNVLILQRLVGSTWTMIFIQGKAVKEHVVRALERAGAAGLKLNNPPLPQFFKMYAICQCRKVYRQITVKLRTLLANLP